MPASDCFFYTLDACFDPSASEPTIGLFLRVGRWPWQENIIIIIIISSIIIIIIIIIS